MIGVTRYARYFLAACIASCLWAGFARADKPGDPAAASSEDGKYLDKDGRPTFKVDKDG